MFETVKSGRSCRSLKCCDHISGRYMVSFSKSIKNVFIKHLATSILPQHRSHIFEFKLEKKGAKPPNCWRIWQLTAIAAPLPIHCALPPKSSLCRQNRHPPLAQHHHTISSPPSASSPPTSMTLLPARYNIFFKKNNL